MKKIIRVFLCTVMLMTVFLCLPAQAKETVLKNQWVVQADGSKAWADSKGKLLKNKFKVIKYRKYYFDENGRMAKKRFITYKGRKYYAGKNGYLVSGWQIIKGKVYYFSSNYRLVTGKVDLDGNSYYFDENGVLQTGWEIVGNKKYYYQEHSGILAKNQTIDGVKVDENGAAALTKADLLDIKVKEILSRITTPSMTQAQKLRACFNYMSSGRNFSYRIINFGWYPGWHLDYAYNMLTSHMGNCYSFACGFAYLAKGIGYHPVMVRGRIPGRRDGAADGLTRHCVVRINGLLYDPEGVYAGFAYVYGNRYYPFTLQIIGTDAI